MFSLFKSIFTQKKRQSDSLEFVWSLVGNIVEKHEYGENREIRKGSKHFSPGAKVYCIPEFGGMGHENITVIGIPRRSRRHIKVTISSSLIENWRIKKVYHPHVVKLLDEHSKWSDSEWSRKEILKYVKMFSK
jgi:hypothetical protein